MTFGGRALQHERLEDRHMLALLGVGPFTAPIIQYDSGGSVNYNSTTDAYVIAATPLTIDLPSTPTGFFFTGAVNVDIQVDAAGALIGGVPGDDFKVTGDVDVDGDFVVDYFAINGPLLTGEISQFGFLDTGGSTDRYDFRFTVTGGQLASYWAGKDIGMVTTSELSNFVNDFNVNFHGGAKGQIGPLDKQSAQLSGHKYTDVTGNGFSGDDTPLAGVTVNLYQDNGVVGVLDGPDVLYTSDVTDAGGAYSFADLAAGNYLVQEVVPAGYQNTTPTTLALSLVAGDNITTGFDFDNFQYAHITGTKFTDITGNSFSADDTGLGGVTINLYQGTSTSDPLVASTLTAADGTYSFDDLALGTYFVQESTPGGYLQTGGNSGYVVVVGAGGLSSGGTSSANDFDNFKKASITGTKFTDITGNSFSADDTGLGGVTINLYLGTSSGGTFVTSTVTAADGTYSFDGLAPGTYFVEETIPGGYVATGGAAGYVVTIGGTGVSSGGTSTGNDFDNFQKASITGTKLTDITGNSFSADDTGLGGVTINLYQGTSTSGPLLTSTVTAADGSYSFGDLAPGTYFVQETTPSGSVQTGGLAGYVVIVGAGGVASGGDSTGNDFDNFKKGSITGSKFTDLTGNSFSADDTGLGGVTINLYQGTSTSGPLVASTTTAADGSYSFGNIGPGTYFVQEVTQAGWLQTGGNSGYTIVATSGFSSTGNDFDNFKKGNITGSKFKDITGNSFSADDTGLGGVTINLYQGTSTSGPLVASTTTAADGSYSFDNIGPGTYFVQEVVQSGWTQTGGNAGYTIVATSGLNGTGNNFDNFQKGQITGKKYKDITGNSFSADDTGLGGVTINLYQGTSTSGSLVASTTTAADGSYSFGNIGPGTYFVQEVVQSGWTQTGGNAGYTIVATSGLNCTGNNFDNFQKGQITGKKYKDITGNSFSADDTGLGGVTIKLYRGTSTSGTLVATTTTAADGSYSFGNLGPGTYFVQEVVQSGWTQTGGNAGYTIVASSGFSSANNNFDNFQNGTINGAKYLDLTGNGLTADDTGLGGVTIQLYRDANNDGQLTAADGGPVATTVTAAGTGAYSFGNVALGTYFVKEVVGSNYISTAPTSGQYKVVVSACGSTTTGLNFANFDTSDCACDISNISYLIDGCTTVGDLRGNTNQGDVVQVTFTIAAGAEPHQYTLVSYTAPGAVFDANTASQQQVFDYDTGIFGPGTYTLEVRIPNSFYQIDFVCGALIDHFGPAGSNIFYSAQGRLLSADNDGTTAVLSNGASVAGMVFVDGNKNNVRDLGEVGIGNTKVTLTGTTSQGQGVTIVGYTKSDGTYLFDNLKAGKYSVAEAQPAGFGDGADILGSLGGTLGSDAFTNVTVAASAKGINYNFGEKLTSLGSGYSAGFQVDTADSSKAAIVVNGTSGTDVITVSYSSSTSKYNVTLNGTSIATLGTKDSANRPVSRLIVNGGKGNDDITVDSSVTVMAELNGGAGHDRLDGGGGYSILVGGDGSDTLLGGSLVNLMIGGNGSDVIVGGSAADLIVAGSTAYDSNATALRAIFAEWTSSRDYNTRTNNLLGVGSGTRANGNYFFSNDKVFDDGEVDRITDAAGRDWLFAHLGMTATDIVTDLAGDELVTSV